MDKLMDSPWFMRVVALVLAVMLFSSVPTNNADESREVDVPSDRSTETISDVPVKTYFDTENLVVTGVPESVQVTLQGPKTLVQQAKTLKDFEVFLDLTNAEIGSQRVPISISGVSERITATVDPAYANISVQEKVTQEFRIEPEFDRNMIAEGYVAGQPEASPNIVKVTGARNIVEKISYVKATVNLKNSISDTVTRDASVRVLDRELNKLDVTVEPETIEVTIPVKSSSKKVPIDIQRQGSSPEGVTIESMTLDTKEATIIAEPDILDKTESVRVEVDLSEITEDTALILPIIISNGVVSVSPEQVKLTVKVNNDDEKTLSNIPIKVQGSDEEYNVDFIDPENGATNIVLSGSRDVVSSLKPDDFDIFVDISRLGEGEHQVDIQVRGPDNLNWELASEKASIAITKQEDV